MSVYRVLEKLEHTSQVRGFRSATAFSPKSACSSTSKRFARRCPRSRRAQDQSQRSGSRQCARSGEGAASWTKPRQAEELVDKRNRSSRAQRRGDRAARAEAKRAKDREGADHYAADVLAEMEVRLAGALGAVQKAVPLWTAVRAMPGQARTALPALAEAAGRAAGGLRSRVAGVEVEQAP